MTNDQTVMFEGLVKQVGQRKSPLETSLRTSTKTDALQAQKIKTALAELRHRGWPSNYVVCSSARDLGRIAKEISTNRIFAFDTETSNLNPWNGTVYCVSIYVGGTSYTINFRHSLLPVVSPLTFSSNLGQYFSDPTIKRVGFNVPFDYHFLEEQLGIKCGEYFFDGWLASWLIAPDLKKGERRLKSLATVYLGEEKQNYKEMFGNTSWVYCEPTLASYYACADAELHYRLYESFDQKLAQTPALHKLYHKLENSVANIDYEVEREGFLVDTHYLKDELAIKLQSQLAELEADIHAAGIPQDVLISSPEQLSTYLFDVTGLPRIRGNSTDQYVLRELQDKHPAIPKLLEYRTISKLKTGFVDNLSILIRDGRLHPQINSIGTATGRSTTENPSLMNLPVKAGSLIRRAFIAEDDYAIVSKDIKGQELRILAHLAGPGRLREVAQSGDIYAEAAAAFYGGNPSDYKKGDKRRDLGKVVILAIFYGAREKKISLIFDCSITKAKNFLDRLYSRFPELQVYMDGAISFSKKYGYTQDILGRRRYFDYANTIHPMERFALERKAANFPVQSSASSQLKAGFVRCHQYLKMNGFKSRARFRIHDEIVFWMHKNEVHNEALHQDLDTLITQSVKMDVPFEVTTEIYGKRWLEKEDD